jgi:AmiR/NasT family two-component response regulator
MSVKTKVCQAKAVKLAQGVLATDVSLESNESYKQLRV